MVKKILWSEKKLGQTKFFVKKIIGKKEFLIKKNSIKKKLGEGGVKKI